MDTDHFDLGEGVSLCKTFAHFMAPFMMAFSPAEKGKHHPGPLSAVKGGIGLDIHIQLHVPSDFSKEHYFDRLNTIWWITALLRLRGAVKAHAPIIADRPLADIPQNWREATILPVEFLPSKIFRDTKTSTLSLDDLIWLKENWLSGGQLMNQSIAFNDAFQALDNARSMPSESLALLAIWGALEQLFSPAKQELRFRISANMASYLEAPGEARLSLHQQILKLYDERSAVAHGGKLKAHDAWPKTHELAKKVLLKIIKQHSVPTKDDLERRLFSAE